MEVWSLIDFFFRPPSSTPAWQPLTCWSDGQSGAYQSRSRRSWTASTIFALFGEGFQRFSRINPNVTRGQEHAHSKKLFRQTHREHYTSKRRNSLREGAPWLKRGRSSIALCNECVDPCGCANYIPVHSPQWNNELDHNTVFRLAIDLFCTHLGNFRNRYLICDAPVSLRYKNTF